jgi:hypothetical protein
MRWIQTIILMTILLAAGSAMGDTLKVGSASGVTPGDTVQVPISLENASTDATAFLLRLDYDPAVLSFESVSDGAIWAAGHTLELYLPEPGRINIIVDDPSGSSAFTARQGVLATMVFTLKQQTAQHYSDITLTSTLTSSLPASGLLDTSGQNISHNVTSGRVTLEMYTLTYAAAENGTIVGDASQTVVHGSDGSPVEALAAENYQFAAWSDGSTENPRTDLNVTEDISVTASFEALEYPGQYNVVCRDQSGPVEFEEYEWGIYVPEMQGPGVLSITRVRGLENYSEIPGLYVNGSLRALVTRGNIGELYVTGDLKRLIAPKAYVGKICSRNLRSVRMVGLARSASSGGTEEYSTCVYSGGEVKIEHDDATGQTTGTYANPAATGSLSGSLYPVVLQLAGVSLEEFRAPLQAASVTVGPKKFAWREGRSRYLDVSYGRIPALGTNVIEAGLLQRLVVLGGGPVRGATDNEPAIGASSIRSLARVQGRTGTTKMISRRFLTRTNLPYTGTDLAEYSGSTSVTAITVNSDRFVLGALMGDLKVGHIEAAGMIPVLLARHGAIETGTVWAGTDQRYETPHIFRIIGDEGVSGDFKAGVDSDGTASRKGTIVLMAVNNRFYPGALIEGNVWLFDEAVRRLIGNTGDFSQNPAE